MKTSRLLESAGASRTAVPLWAWVLTLGGVTGTLVFDLLTPLGVAGGAPYVILILLGLWTRSPRFVVGLAALSFALVLLGMFLSPAGLGPSIYFTNRALTLFAIAVCTVLVVYQLGVGRRLREAHSVLEVSQQELAASEHTMQAVVENAVEGIITVDTRGTIQTANRAAREIFGYREDELLGRNVSMLMPPPDRDQHDGYILRYIETGVAGIIGKGREVIALHKNGERIPVYLSVSDVRHAAGLFTGVVRDLREEKRVQRKLLEQEALATLGRMAAVVAHEVKNPLAGIAGVIQVLRRRAEAGSEDYQVMGDVLARIDSLVETLQDLLFYARPRELRPMRTGLAELLRETARLLENDEQVSGVEVEIPDVDCEVELDVEYFREAVLNLFLNAAQAMGGRGRIRTQIENGAEFCHVRVIDDGPGIPDEIREKVFEPFFTTKFRGTGLGLALVKRVVDLHDGRISIECPAGGGTTVTLSLRRAPSPAGR